MLNKIICALCLSLCAACGSYKAVRPDAPLPVIAQAQTYSVRYQSAQGRTITAIYINSHQPDDWLSCVKAIRLRNWCKSACAVRALEYANPSSRWQIGDGFAVLIRGGKKLYLKRLWNRAV